LASRQRNPLTGSDADGRSLSSAVSAVSLRGYRDQRDWYERPFSAGSRTSADRDPLLSLGLWAMIWAAVVLALSALG